MPIGEPVPSRRGVTSVTSPRLQCNTRRHRSGRSSPLPPCRSIATCTRPHTAIAETRHTAAYRMARDPAMPITDVQWVLGHASLTTTQIYTNPLPEDVIAAVLAHHDRRTDGRAQRPASGEEPASQRYRPESLDVLFGRSSR